MTKYFEYDAGEQSPQQEKESPSEYVKRRLKEWHYFTGESVSQIVEELLIELFEKQEKS